MMKNMTAYSLSDIKALSCKLCIFSIVGYGLYIWLFKYFPDMLREKDHLRFILTRHMFFYLQILLTLCGFLLLHSAIKHQFNKKHVFFYFLFSTILVQTRFFHELHFWLRSTNFYLDVFKTAQNATVVPSFQYARVMLIGIISILFIASLLFLRRTVQKVFLVVFMTVFFIFFFFMHLNIGRAAYKDYEAQLAKSFEIILANGDQHEKFCEDFKLQCFVIDKKDIEDFNEARPSIENTIVSTEDPTAEANRLARKFMKDFAEKDQDYGVLLEADFVTDNLRGTVFGFKKLNDHQLLLLIDFNNLAYALDLYLNYFTFIIQIFLCIWIPVFIWLYGKHKRFALAKKFESTPSPS